ncbi:MAG TPA: hypothetical protein VGQ30_13885, partial [Gemmatimonadaceae bacterium]|nr:hypothetical protein [Gemmatimonadaceae bacterium]
MTRSLQSIFAALTLAAIPFTGAHAQVIRDPGAVASAPSSITPGSAIEAGHRAQQDFEHFRRLHLPNASV